MTYDLVVRGGRVVDGTGLPGYTADVAVVDGRIAKVGRVDEDAAEVVDADGLTVTPGFVDVHTHYDAQLHFEPTASPSSWHGVTTVFTGNCGFTFAPAKPDDVDWLLAMLSRVEGMSPDALATGVTFEGGSFADYLAGFDGRVAVNVAANVGHCAVRRWVMGDDASERPATDDEIRRMQELVRQAMREGAAGFTSSQLDLHVAHDGRGVPSNHATAGEIVALASVLAEFDHGAIEFIPRTFLEGYDEADRALLLAMYRASGKPIEVNTLSRIPHAPDGWERSLEFVREASETEGARIHPMFAANHQGAHFTLDTTFLFDEYPTFRSALTLPAGEREARLRDPSLRDALRTELADWSGKSFLFVPQVMRVEVVTDPAHAGWVDRTISELAAERGQDDLDAFLDMSLEEGLRTQFVLAAPPDAARLAATEALIRDPRTLAGSSDAGAHLLSFCGADYPTRLLTEWVPDVLTFEQAVHRLTAFPAGLHGIADRGVIRPGAWADLVLLDRTQLGTTTPRLAADFPAASTRFVVDATGYEAVMVNGVPVFRRGQPTGATPGRVLRGR